MIHIERKDGKVTAGFDWRSPVIYLDHWALRYISDNKPEGIKQRFSNCFKTHGTLFFGWENISEIANNSGESLTKMKGVFRDVGKNWIPLEGNPVLVSKREQAFVQGDPPPCISPDFLRLYAENMENENLSLESVVDHFGARRELKAITDGLKEDGIKFFEEERKKYNPLRKFTFSREQFFLSPVYCVWQGLADLVLKESFKITENDIMDFFHACVSSATADIVLLDPKWASLVQKLKLPTDEELKKHGVNLKQLRVFNPSQLNEFIEYFETLSCG